MTFSPLHKLKSKLLEEPLVITGLMLLLENPLDGLLGVLTFGGLIESLLGNGRFQTIVVEAITGGHDVSVIDTLDERLDLGSASNLLLGVLACDL